MCKHVEALPLSLVYLTYVVSACQSIVLEKCYYAVASGIAKSFYASHTINEHVEAFLSMSLVDLACYTSAFVIRACALCTINKRVEAFLVKSLVDLAYYVSVFMIRTHAL